MTRKSQSKTRKSFQDVSELGFDGFLAAELVERLMKGNKDARVMDAAGGTGKVGSQVRV